MNVPSPTALPKGSPDSQLLVGAGGGRRNTKSSKAADALTPTA